MKKIIVCLCTLIASAAIVSAQDVNEATDLYNNAATALSTGDKIGALESFQKALKIAQACGEAGEEIAANCLSVMPQVSVSIAKDYIKSAEFDTAVAKLKEAIALCTSLGDEDYAKEAESLIPQTYMQKGNANLKAKNFAEAISAFNEVLAITPDNGRAAFSLGQAYNASGKADKAEEAFLLAAANGQEKQAYKQLAIIYLKKASAANKAQNFAEAVKLAEQSISYNPTEKAYYVAGRASQSQNKNADAVKYYEKYLEAAPAASNAEDVKKVIEELKKAL